MNTARLLAFTAVYASMLILTASCGVQNQTQRHDVDFVSTIGGLPLIVVEGIRQYNQGLPQIKGVYAYVKQYRSAAALALLLDDRFVEQAMVGGELYTKPVSRIRIKDAAYRALRDIYEDTYEDINPQLEVPLKNAMIYILLKRIESDLHEDVPGMEDKVVTALSRLDRGSVDRAAQ